MGIDLLLDGAAGVGVDADDNIRARVRQRQLGHVTHAERRGHAVHVHRHLAQQWQAVELGRAEHDVAQARRGALDSRTERFPSARIRVSVSIAPGSGRRSA